MATVRRSRGVFIGLGEEQGTGTSSACSAANAGVHRTAWGNSPLADTSDRAGSTVLGDQLSRCLWEAAHEPYVGIFLGVGIQPVRMPLTHGEYRVVPVNK